VSQEKTIYFSALDTLFFRESRPFDTIGGSELSSVFPPPPRTVLGALRSAIGDELGADWRAFSKNEDYTVKGKKLRTLIGYGNDLGELTLDGLWLSQDGERLYPAPLFLLHRAGEESFYKRLRIGNAIKTNLGTTHLPIAPQKNQGYHRLESAWLTRAGLESVLSGGLPSQKTLHLQSDLLKRESRLGIARDNSKRTVEKGLLYQTCHVRPNAGLAIDADISGLNEEINIDNSVVRLGGEGRMAGIKLANRPTLAKAPKTTEATRGVILVLLTPARFGAGKNGWLPPNFKHHKENELDVWRGHVHGIALTLRCAVLGKAEREGGWDVAEGKPRDVLSLIPSGSCYYCTVDDGNISAAIASLHGKPLGEDQQYGRGVIGCGLWNQNEFPTENSGEKT